jgi:predicted nucleic acid-binding protein
MATLTRELTNFTGESGQDIEAWLQELALKSQAAKLITDDLLGLVIKKEKKEALSYILSYIKGNLNSTSCEELIQALKKRLRNAVNTDAILDRFLTI